MWPETDEVTILDQSVERPGVDDAIAGDDLKYRIYVQQFATYDNGEERPVRKQEEENGMEIPIGDIATPADDLSEIGRSIRVLLT